MAILAFDQATLVLGVVPAGTELHLPFTAVLKDLSPPTGDPITGTVVGVDGIHGHRIEKTLQLQLEMKDSTGATPDYPVLVQLNLSGPSRGKLLVNGGLTQCDQVAFLWHERDSQGTVIPNDAFGYRLGTWARYVGVVPDAGQPGGVTPVWGTAETLHLAAQAKLPDAQRSDPLLVAYGVHPEPGRPDAMACWQHDGQPCGDTFRFWPGYLEAYGLYDAYHVVDAFGNTVFGLTGASATEPGSGITVDFTSQLTTGGSPQGYTLDVAWPTGASQPSGPFPVTLGVDVPADPAGDWPAATVSKAITLDFEGGETRMLVQKQRYDARFSADDGGMPMIVAPGAGEGGLPLSPAGDTPRLVLLAVRGTQVPWAIVGGSDEPSLEPDKVYRSQLGTWQKVQATPGSQDVVLDTQPGGTVRLSLVDGSFNVVPATAFRVHRCPRGEHLTEESPAPEPCTLGPVDSDGMTGILPSLALNPAGGARGYLGIELTKAPVDPGTYYVLVESTGATPYRIRQGADLVRRAGQDSEYLGAYAVCTVAGGEFLDESFQRFPDGLIQVAQPSRLYLRVWVQPGTPPISAVLHATRQTGEVVETGVGITTAPLARSGYQMAPFVAIPEGNTEAVPSPDPPIHLATWFGRLEARTAGGGGRRCLVDRTARRTSRWDLRSAGWRRLGDARRALRSLPAPRLLSVSTASSRSGRGCLSDDFSGWQPRPCRAGPGDRHRHPDRWPRPP
ncbi:MAG: hypothetical protein AB2L07_12945 [Thermoanaerobaculaceae bacterium]